MKNLRDFFYNTSDVIVVVLIVVVAAGLITWRTDTILKYPADLVSGVHASDVKNGPITTPYEPQNESPEGTGETTNHTTDEGTFSEPESYSLYINSGDSLQTIGSNLVSMGCFTTASEFVDLVVSNGLDTKIQMGNHIFPASSTKLEIVQTLCKPGV